jgi:hypothetical protein
LQGLPNALHGGYLRDLAWMFTDVAENAAGMVEAAQNVVGG